MEIELKALKLFETEFIAQNGSSVGPASAVLDTFGQSDKPYEVLLNILQASFATRKNVLLRTYILQSFKEWVKRADLILTIDLELKEEALVLASTYGPSTSMKEILIVFEIHMEPEISLLLWIKKMMSKDRYNTASRAISLLNLYNNPVCVRIFLALIAQDRMNPVERLLELGGHFFQITMTSYLDSFLTGQEGIDNLKSVLMAYEIPGIRYTNLEIRVLTKLTKRLAKKFNVAIDMLPNLRRRHIRSSLRFMAHQAFTDNKISRENFEELSTIAVKNESTAQIDLLELLLEYNEDTFALSMAQKFGLPEQNWPEILRRTPVEELNNRNISTEEDWESDHLQTLEGDDLSRAVQSHNNQPIIAQEDWEAYDSVVYGEEQKQSLCSLAPGEDLIKGSTARKNMPSDEISTRKDGKEYDISFVGYEEENRLVKSANSQLVAYYEFPLEAGQITIVDNLASFDALINRIKQENLLAIDAEWPPTFDSFETTSASVLQIATTSQVYILDVISLQKSLTGKQKEDFLNSFYTEKSLIIGFSFSEDLNKLEKLFPGIKEKQGSSSNLLDLLKLWGLIKKNKPEVLPYKDLPAEQDVRRKGGLSELVRQCFDVTLDKREQLSNWSRRPLTNAQVLYAASDAYVLIQIYELISKAFAPEEWKEIICSCTRKQKQERKPKKEKKKKFTEKNQQMLNVCYPAKIMAKDVKFLCVSTNLGRLGRSLRSCGIDTLYTHTKTTGMTDQEIVETSIREKRLVVCAGANALKIKSHLPPGSCYQVHSGDPALQLKEVLLYFNVCVEEKDIFSRCQICNSDKFHAMTNSSLMKLACLQNDNMKNGSEPVVLERQMYQDRAGVNLTKLARNIITVSEEQCASGYTIKNAPILYQSVPVDIIKNVALFYVCTDCGKVYWEGSHAEKVLQGCLKFALINS
ncbi:uncharacterized protein LOC136032986 isoform X1 [Artemia franciscana]